MSVGIWIFDLGWSLLGGQRLGVERVREPLPHTCCRNGRFIPVGGELVRTPGPTLIVPRGTTELYGGHAGATVWGEGVARHTVLMAHGGVGQCRTRAPPPRTLSPLPT
ncbi:hypothetical protein BHE74_00018406 [Ensete ventricosum]|nr:hypothetical protein BHE74_00018406 [Ensete ventricosum]